MRKGVITKMEVLLPEKPPFALDVQVSCLLLKIAKTGLQVSDLFICIILAEGVNSPDRCRYPTY